jgi:hypothetical protein
MTTDTDEQQPAERRTNANDNATQPHRGSLAGKVARRIARARIGRVPVGGLLAAVAIVALLGTAYGIGTPTAGAHVDAERAGATGAHAVGGFSSDMAGGSGGGAAGVAKLNSLALPADGGTTTTTGVDQLTATLEANQIVKTGSMALEVTDLDKAVSQAQSTIVGMGGNVSQSSSSGEKDSAVATVEYRVPVARWDDALAAMRALGTRVISEQTDSTDATAQVIDLDARISNLQATESALQSIMARASAIPDVLAVEQQLSTTEGQIEELSAQQTLLKNQAAMSTLTVSFSTLAETDTTQAAQGWDLGAQIDQAVATLVHIGQGLVTIVVWAVVVGLPVAIGLALLWAIWWIVRRIARRRRGAVAAA